MVTSLDNVPPLPLTRESLELFNCLSPPSPRSCRTASTNKNNPYIPGCQYDNPPPFVFTGNFPPGAMVPSSTNLPPSPFSQKPRSSKNSKTLIVKASYSSRKSISFGETPAISYALSPAYLADVVVKSCMELILLWSVDSP